MGEPALNVPPLEGTLLEAPLTAPAHRPPESSEEVDPRLELVTEQVARGEYAQAARGAEALLREGFHDARLVGPYLFGAFLEHGPQSLPGLFRSVSQVLTESWALLLPEGKRTVFTDIGLRWLFRNISKHLGHFEKKKDATWQRWCDAASRAPLEEALGISEPLLAILAETLPDNGCEEALRTFTIWLRRHVQTLPEPTPPPPPPEAPKLVIAPAEPPPAPAATERPVDIAPTPAPAPAPAASPGLAISPAMALLLRKLEAFDTLLDRGDMLRAGVVATDVLATVEQFDPRVYLPALFSSFFSGLSQHARELEPGLRASQSLARRALEQLYRVDLDTFLAQADGDPEEED